MFNPAFHQLNTLALTSKWAWERELWLQVCEKCTELLYELQLLKHMIIKIKNPGHQHANSHSYQTMHDKQQKEIILKKMNEL